MKVDGCALHDFNLLVSGYKPQYGINKPRMFEPENRGIEKYPYLPVFDSAVLW